MADDKAREKRLRRMAAKQGLSLHLSRIGRFQLLDADGYGLHDKDGFLPDLDAVEAELTPRWERASDQPARAKTKRLTKAQREDADARLEKAVNEAAATTRARKARKGKTA